MKYFLEICKIPHGSGNEKGLSDYIVNFAKERNLSFLQDEVFNLIVKKPATKGYEHSPAVIIQSHLDMVCEKNADKEHDFIYDPITTIIEGDYIRADKTTLGADNGAAVAMTLALLDSSEIPHPAIEAVFTTGEEVGLLGASNLDTSPLEGKILLNVDTGVEGQFLSSCAGGVRVNSDIPAEYTQIPTGYEPYSLKVKGLKGGHSGECINKERGNSNRLLARTINKVCETHKICAAKINGGDKVNAIPREAEAVIFASPKDFDDIAKIANQFEACLKNEYKNSDADVCVVFEKYDGNDTFEKVFSDKTLRNTLSSILLTPNGVVAMSTDIEGLVETSCNVGVVETNGNVVTVSASIRSSVSTRKQSVYSQIILLNETIGAATSHFGDYPSWEFNPKSRIRDIICQTYEELFNKKPVVAAIHAGLECGIFADKLKGLDIVSFGPTMHDIHTPDERMSISSFNRTWELIKAVLHKIK